MRGDSEAPGGGPTDTPVPFPPPPPLHPGWVPPPPPPPVAASASLLAEAKALSDSILLTLEKARLVSLRLLGLIFLLLGVEDVLLALTTPESNLPGFEAPLGLAFVAIAGVYIFLPQRLRAFQRRWPWVRWIENPDRKLPLQVSGALRELMRGREAYSQVSKIRGTSSVVGVFYAIMVVLVGAIAGWSLLRIFPGSPAILAWVGVMAIALAAAILGYRWVVREGRKIETDPLAARLASLNWRLLTLEQEFWRRY